MQNVGAPSVARPHKSGVRATSASFYPRGYPANDSQIGDAPPRVSIVTPRQGSGMGPDLWCSGRPCLVPTEAPVALQEEALTSECGGVQQEERGDHQCPRRSGPPTVAVVSQLQACCNEGQWCLASTRCRIDSSSPHCEKGVSSAPRCYEISNVSPMASRVG
ncbi:hypothetical protein NDU88_010521 [Pleurodeles waltl]|uniref:Uncharacterized protein n=1 Tax=Pleurodeles waltl TaxID=8319 RepID=A0AAV7RZW2_PLEWA|nr:hypothetical protein NDU88_010521 [Pleurodeles waltl]